MTARLYVNHLTLDEISTLRQLHCHHPKPATRRRAHIILLNNQGISVAKIAPMMNKTRQAIAITIRRWKEDGICGLFDKKRSGRPKTLSPVQEEQVLKMIHKSPRSLKSVVNEIKKK